MSVFLNVILLNGLWLASVLGASYQLLWPAFMCLMLLLTVIFIFRDVDTKFFKFMLFSSIYGLLIDAGLKSIGLVVYASNEYMLYFMPPWWIVCLWVGFSASLSTGLYWVFDYPKIGALFMFIGAPLSYVSAAKLGAVELKHVPITVTFIGVAWLLYFVLIFQLKQRLLLRQNVLV